MSNDLIPSDSVIEAVSAYDSLSSGRRAFVDFYIMQLNAIRAYQSVFPSAPSDVAAKQSSYWARDPLIRAAISERTATVAERNAISIERVLNEIGALAFSNIKHYLAKDANGYVLLDANGKPYFDFQHATDAQWSAVSEMTIDELQVEGRKVVRTKIKLHDKNAALDKLMKRFGAYAPERVMHTHTGANGGPIAHATMTAEQLAQMYADTLRIGQDE